MPNHRITIINEQHSLEITSSMEELLSQAAIATLNEEGWEEEVEVNIVLVESETIQDMNLDFRGVDRPTDVLSFATMDEIVEDGHVYDFALPSDLEHYPLGDIVIATSIAMAQAKALEHSIYRELAFLTVHGMLHLLGYEHLDETTASDSIEMEINDLGLEEMVEIQERVLTSLGQERKKKNEQ